MPTLKCDASGSEDEHIDSDNEPIIGSNNSSSSDDSDDSSNSSSSESSTGDEEVKAKRNDDKETQKNTRLNSKTVSVEEIRSEQSSLKNSSLGHRGSEKVNGDVSDVDSNAPAGARSRSPSPGLIIKDSEAEKPPGRKNMSVLRTGGAYLPPAKARLLQQQIQDKSSEQYQRLAWDALKKSINGLVNKVNIGNISIIVRELFQENLVRGRGILAKAIMQAQSFSPTFTQVYAALVAVINTRLPQTGELLCKRLIVTFRKSFKRQDKAKCMLAGKFLAHLVNQNVCHEIIALEILSLLLQENPTDDSVEVAITFLKDVGFKLAELSPRGLTVVMERLRYILHEGLVALRTQYAIEVMMAVRKDAFKEHLPIREGLDLVEEEDQITHMLQLDGKYQIEDLLNIFRFDQTYLENEANYKGIRDEILGSSDEEDSGDSSDESSIEVTTSEEELDDAAMAEKAAQARENGLKIDIFDKTQTDIVHFRRTLYLTIQSSLDYEECAHKLLKINVGEDMTLIKEMCGMMIDCCQQQRTYEKFYGLLAARFCLLKKEFMLAFEELVVEQYETIHRRDTIMLRNTAKMISHMLHADALTWSVMACIRISEDSTSSSSRVFIKLLFQDLAECMGLPKLAERLFDKTLGMFFTGLFPKDSPQDTRFAINFWTSIGLGALTEDLREHLKFIKATDKGNKKKKKSGSDDDSSSSDDADESADSDGSDGQGAVRKKRRRTEAVDSRRREIEESRYFKEEINDHVSRIRNFENEDSHTSNHYDQSYRSDRGHGNDYGDHQGYSGHQDNYRDSGNDRRNNDSYGYNEAGYSGGNNYGYAGHNQDQYGTYEREKESSSKSKSDRKDDRRRERSASRQRDKEEKSRDRKDRNKDKSSTKYGDDSYKHRTEYETRGESRKRRSDKKSGKKDSTQEGYGYNRDKHGPSVDRHSLGHGYSRDRHGKSYDRWGDASGQEASGHGYSKDRYGKSNDRWQTDGPGYTKGSGYESKSSAQKGY